MINLLPEQYRDDLKFARMNSILLHWAMAFVAAILGLCLITGLGYLSINKSVSTYSNNIKNTQTLLNKQDINGVTKSISDVSGNLKLMVTVLSHEVLFSKLLQQFGEITPSNVVLTNLSISENQSAIDVTAQATNYTSATQLEVNLASPSNRIFSNADIVSISCSSPGSSVSNTGSTLDTKYPCTVDIRAVFAKDNPFLFINMADTLGNNKS